MSVCCGHIAWQYYYTTMKIVKQDTSYLDCNNNPQTVVVQMTIFLYIVYRWRISNASKPHISKMDNVQETQKTVSKQTRYRVFATSIFCHFYRLCLRILVQVIDTL